MADYSSHEAPAHKAQSLPVVLPSKLVGRDTTLAQVYGQLKANKPILIYGASGIGKTALAATLASAYTELPGGALWLTVNNSPLEELLVRVGRAYGVEEITSSDTPIGMIGAVASTLTANKPLVVLDGLHNAQATSQFVSRCAEGLPVMLISKDPLEGWPGLALTGLDETAGIALFKQLLNGVNGASDDDLDELASILDYIPYAITIAAGTMRIAKQSPADYLTAFEQIPSSAGATPQLLALTSGFRSLNNALQGILLLLGATFSGGASGELLSIMSGAPQETIEQVMTMLSGSGFVERLTRYDMPYYRLHEITYGFAQTWLRGSGRLEALQTKVRDSMLHYVRKYNTDSPGAFDHLAAEMDEILGVARWCAERGEREMVNQLVVDLTQAGDFVNERGYLYELLALRKLASSSTTAFPAYPGPSLPPEDLVVDEDEDRDLDDEDEADEIEGIDDEDDEEEAAPAATPRPPVAVFNQIESSQSPSASSLLDLEEEFEDEEDFDEDDLDEDEDLDDEDESDSSPLTALESTSAGETTELGRLQAALRQARLNDEPDREAELLTQLGDLQVKLNMDNEAITSYTEALERYETLDDPENTLEILDTLSALMVKTDNANAAIMHAMRGVQLAEDLGDSQTQMYLLTTLGDARQQSGESGQAVQAFQRALELARSTGDAQNEALILFKLGYAQLDNSDPDTASETWEQALQLFKLQGKRAYEGRVLGGLGTAYGELGRWQEAINFHTSALYIAREVADRDEEALELSNLGYAAIQANQLGEAVMRYRQALHLAYQMNDKDNIVTNIVDLARLLVESPRHLDIAELLVNDAMTHDGLNRDLSRLKDRIQQEKLRATADGVQQLPVSGTAQDYAANAYKLLEA
jgi:tetratricopeptide (TPR) repeat protein/energy-coupling factor transporter ATP-binding protein EcfA2